MKRRNASILKTRKKSKNYKCEGCNSVFHNISQFKHHVKTNIPCRLKLKYCCDFCGYIGYDSDGLQRHLPYCSQKVLCTSTPTLATLIALKLR